MGPSTCRSHALWRVQVPQRGVVKRFEAAGVHHIRAADADFGIRKHAIFPDPAEKAVGNEHIAVCGVQPVRVSRKQRPHQVVMAFNWFFKPVADGGGIRVRHQEKVHVSKGVLQNHFLEIFLKDRGNIQTSGFQQAACER